MSHLTIYKDDAVSVIEASSDHQAISKTLSQQGVRFQKWHASAPVAFGDSSEAILSAYQQDISALVEEEGFCSVDVISVSPQTPDIAVLRQKFLSEHRHTEDEVRMFVDGCGLFYLHIGDRIFSVLCEKGDLISVPANTPHWFDMGEKPTLAAIRFFNNPEGWVAHYSGSDIASRYPLLER